jgi:hypothetical protein
MQLLAARPALKDIVSEAARALAQLDADRLEELALSCQALNRDLMREAGGDSSPSSSRDRDSGIVPFNAVGRARLAAEAREARRDMALFARVLDATRANVHVIERLRDLRSGRLEYSAWRAPRWPATDNGSLDSIQSHDTDMGSLQTESRHGND